MKNKRPKNSFDLKYTKSTTASRRGALGFIHLSCNAKGELSDNPQYVLTPEQRRAKQLKRKAFRPKKNKEA